MTINPTPPVNCRYGAPMGVTDMDTNEVRDALNAFLAEHAITMGFEFVPFSKSRNAGQKYRSLNYVVDIHVGGRKVLQTDYSMGIGCVPEFNRVGRKTIAQEEFTSETGRDGPRNPIITPDPVDVIACLAMDADVLEYGTFEEWAESLGFDPDSRKAERIWRECIGVALALRNALGSANLARLRELANEW